MTADQIDETTLASLGYRAIRRLPAGDEDYQGCLAALMPLMSTTAIVVGFTSYGYEDRWCYYTHDAALAALNAWNGTGEPIGWHRHPNTGRRRDASGVETINW